MKVMDAERVLLSKDELDEVMRLRRKPAFMWKDA
jgi:hypothetical protein